MPNRKVVNGMLVKLSLWLLNSVRGHILLPCQCLPQTVFIRRMHYGQSIGHTIKFGIKIILAQD